MKLRNYLIVGTMAALMTSCHAPSKVAYMPEAETIPASLLNQIPAVTDPILSPGDLLNIQVFSADQTAVAPFNKGQYITSGGDIGTTKSNTNTSNTPEAATEFYLVGTDGEIEMPIIGRIKVTGLTKEQLANQIADEIYPKYIKIKPSVEVRLMNFKVTVLGQVKSPGVYVSKNERLNILEALAMAGDLDIMGERENVMLIRSNPDGTREVQRLNLNDRNLLLSPYFNLHQNDFIYVEPNRSAKAKSWQIHQGWQTAITIVGGISSVSALVVGIINLTDDK